MQSTRTTSREPSNQWRTLGGLRVREVYYAPHRHQPRHRHSESSLSLVLAGQLEETSAHARYRAVAGSLVMKPAGHWHADTYGPRGARVVQILPARQFAPMDGGHDYRWLEAPRLARRVIGLLYDSTSTAESTELAMWEAFDRLTATVESERPAARPGWWDDAVDLLDECVERSVSVADVAARLGVHPVHLARVCRRQFGCTSREYMRGRRVLAAWRAWQRGEEPLAAIAVRVGFADQAHMTRCFAKELGVSPGRLRRLTALPERHDR